MEKKSSEIKVKGSLKGFQISNLCVLGVGTKGRKQTPYVGGRWAGEKEHLSFFFFNLLFSPTISLKLWEIRCFVHFHHKGDRIERLKVLGRWIKDGVGPDPHMLHPGRLWVRKGTALTSSHMDREVIMNTFLEISFRPFQGWGAALWAVHKAVGMVLCINQKQ